jgi:uncharacterized FlaG/YvyC family protein
MKTTKSPLPTEQPIFRLLDMPLEIRLLIFTCMNALPRHDHLNLLCCSRRVRKEAEESFLSRPLSFHNQRELNSLVHQDNQRCCQNSRDLTLALTDMDDWKMQQIMRQLLSNTPTPKVMLESPYEMESQLVINALQSFRNLNCFSLVENDDTRHTPAPSVLLNSVLSWTMAHHPRLSRLRIDSSNISLEPLLKLTHLRSLSINAYSDTSTSTMATIFAHLSSLQHLEITCYTRQALYFRPQQTNKSINSEVIRQIPPLKSLHIHDRGRRGDLSAPYLTTELLEAIRATQTNVRELSITSINPVGREVQEQLALTLESMQHLHTLVLHCPETELSSLKSLPATIWSLTYLVKDKWAACEAKKVVKLLAKRSELRVLRKIAVLFPPNSGPLPASPGRAGPGGKWDVTYRWGDGGYGDWRLGPVL